MIIPVVELYLLLMHPSIKLHRNSSFLFVTTLIDRNTKADVTNSDHHTLPSIAAWIMKQEAQRDANTADWLYQGGVKYFRPAADPLSGGAGRPKFNQLEMVTTFTYKPSLVIEDRCTQFRVIVVTDPQTHTHTHTHKHTHKQTHRQDRLQYTAPLSSARSVTKYGTKPIHTCLYGTVP